MSAFVGRRRSAICCITVLLGLLAAAGCEGGGGSGSTTLVFTVADGAGCDRLRIDVHLDADDAAAGAGASSTAVECGLAPQAAAAGCSLTHVAASVTDIEAVIENCPGAAGDPLLLCAFAGDAGSAARYESAAVATCACECDPGCAQAPDVCVEKGTDVSCAADAAPQVEGAGDANAGECPNVGGAATTRDRSCGNVAGADTTTTSSTSSTTTSSTTTTSDSSTTTTQETTTTTLTGVTTTLCEEPCTTTTADTTTTTTPTTTTTTTTTTNPATAINIALRSTAQIVAATIDAELVTGSGWHCELLDVARSGTISDEVRSFSACLYFEDPLPAGTTEVIVCTLNASGPASAEADVVRVLGTRLTAVPNAEAVVTIVR